ALAVTADVKDAARDAAPGAQRDSGEAARVRAGTARNAQPTEPRSAQHIASVPSGPEPGFDPALAPTADGDERDGRDDRDEPAASSTLPGGSPGLPPEARDAERVPFHLPVQADPPPRGDTLITLTGRAPGPSTSSGEASVTRSVIESSPAVVIDAPPGRALPLTTLTGRAPGPSPAPTPAESDLALP